MFRGIKMNNLLTKVALFTSLALTVIACGPGGSSGLAGIGGSGYVSSGSVTGFGSVFVNGVEFETDSATFDVDGSSGTQADLAIGMIVRVDGTINDDGVTGTATNISFDDELQGPVFGIQDIGNDGIKRSFSVLGTTVIIDSGSTTFDVSGDLPASTVFDFGTIVDDNNVEISGFFDSNGDIQVTRVELKDIVFDANSIVEVKGIIKDLSGTTFNLGNLIVDASVATIDDFTNGLVNDQLVEVKGTFDTVSNTINATLVEAEDESIEDNDEFELEGLISGFVDKNTIFKIGSISVDASKAMLEPATLVLDDDIRVEAEGAIINGVLIATEIELEGGEIKIHANVTSVDVDSSTFEVTPVTGQNAITVTVTTDTQLQDDVGDIEPYTLVHLFNNPGFVEVQGFDDGAGGIIATEVELEELSDVVVQGYATAATGNAAGGMMTVLGVEIEYDIDTIFEDDNELRITGSDITALIDSISPATPKLVKVQIDKGADEIADQIELESP